MRARVREYRPEDLGQVLQLWESGTELSPSADWLALDQAVDLISAEQGLTFVAEADGEIVGAALGLASPIVAWVCRLSLRRRPDEAEIAERLLERLEQRLAEGSARKVVAVVREGTGVEDHLARRGYAATGGLLLFERELASLVAPANALVEVGGRIIGSGLWDDLKGMDEPKQIIERHVILPLAEPELALRHGVAPPRAVVLFGPPGTGKTTFAKGIASRLGWPFIEIQPAELAGEGPERQAKLLADVFERVLSLPSAVVFVDEVEDIASIRHAERRVGPSVTNEFLKQIPRLREARHHLLVCATNQVSSLDAAFLRPGRFDYILPVGPPDAGARSAIWRRYIDEITDEEIAVDELVQASELFTPADIEFAARKAAQQAFEREHFKDVRHRAATADFLTAIRSTRPTLSVEALEAFAEDTRRFARF